MEKALDCFNMYVRLAPDVANAYDSRGDYYVKMGDTAAAKENFLKAIELSSIVKSSQEKLDKLEEESWIEKRSFNWKGLAILLGLF